MKILEVLTENGRMSAPEISKKVKIPSRTVLERIKSLEDEGVILQYTIRPDYKKIGKGLTSFILLEFDDAYMKKEKITQRDIAEKIAKRFPFITNVGAITGDSDLIFQVRTKDVDALNRLHDQLRYVEGILRTKTLVVLYEVNLPITKAVLYDP